MDIPWPQDHRHWRVRGFMESGTNYTCGFSDFAKAMSEISDSADALSDGSPPGAGSRPQVQVADGEVGVARGLVGHAHGDLEGVHQVVVVGVGKGEELFDKGMDAGLIFFNKLRISSLDMLHTIGGQK